MALLPLAEEALLRFFDDILLVVSFVVRVAVDGGGSVLVSSAGVEGPDAVGVGDDVVVLLRFHKLVTDLFMALWS